METSAHHRLKRFAIGFLRSRGCMAAATEVRCPISRYRVDAAGYADTVPDPTRVRKRCEPRTVVVECKCSRGDYLRDRRNAERLLDLRRQLEHIRGRIEERRLKVHEPHLRQSGSALFPELEEWDFSASRLRGYQQILRRIRRLERQLHGETKFFTIAHYRLADQLYLAAPRDMIGPGELPPGWGLLECSRRSLDPSAPPPIDALRVAVEAPSRSSRGDFRVRLLRNIAVAACRTATGNTAQVGS